MRIIEYKGKKYKIEKRHCDKCKADAGLNFCINNCDYLMERIPVEIKWVCQNCNVNNYTKDTVLEDEYVDCKVCGSIYAIDIENGLVVQMELI